LRNIIPSDTNKKTLWLPPGERASKILLAASFLLILPVVWLIFIKRNVAFDQTVFDFTAPHITPERTRFMLFITFFGNHLFLIPANLLLLSFFIIKKHNRLAFGIVLVSLGGLSIKLTLKQLFHRLRPGNPLIEGGVPGFSFPSGHALMSVAFYGFLIWLTAHHIHNKWWQRVIIAFLLFFIVTISFSRIYLRLHYTSDVIAGLCTGFIWLSLCLWYTERKKPASSLR
jgi:membrane-associated phospholipid phosphatase